MLPVTDGVVTLRPMEAADAAVLIEGRDAEFRRFLGEGSADPMPTAVVEVGGAVVGWVDHDERDWLADDECNLGYNVFAAHRGRGYGSRAVALLLHHLAHEGRYRTATLLIDRANDRSLALARRLGGRRSPDRDGHPFFRLPVPPLEYADGTVTIRRLRADDLDRDLAAKDDEQMRWLWLPGQRDLWEALSPAEQRDHARRGLVERHDAFGHGPRWGFAVDTAGAPYVAYVEADLANDHVPAGEANISYSAHPGHRGQGLVSAGVRLLLRFLQEHTAAREAHLIVDAENEPSRRVAAAVGAIESSRRTDPFGRTMVRHVVALGREQP